MTTTMTKIKNPEIALVVICQGILHDICWSDRLPSVGTLMQRTPRLPIRNFGKNKEYELRESENEKTLVVVKVTMFSTCPQGENAVGLMAEALENSNYNLKDPDFDWFTLAFELGLEITAGSWRPELAAIIEVAPPEVHPTSRRHEYWGLTPKAFR